jgi:hypothetical protein
MKLGQASQKRSQSTKIQTTFVVVFHYFLEIFSFFSIAGKLLAVHRAMPQLASPTNCVAKIFFVGDRAISPHF